MWVKKLLIRAFGLLGFTVAGVLMLGAHAYAATITVNNADDTTSNDGACTLREAIIAANSDTVSGAAVGECAAGSGSDIINFAITAGGTTFINQSQTGYTITPSSELPDITEPVVINGYSQPGALANTAQAPNPLNGRLLIEIDGSNAGTANGLSFITNSSGSAVRGLVIGDFASGDGLNFLADNMFVQGNYIGTDPTGSTAKPNTVGVNTNTSSPNVGENILVGGLNAADRNLISGNTSGPTATASYPASGWVFQGNYIGVAADGLTPIANSTNGGSGALSIDNCSNVTIGGSQPTAINVFGASLGHGLAPDIVTNVTIEGNYIGLGYDGTTVLGNVTGPSTGSGLSVSNLTTTSIVNNRIAGWKQGGVAINGNVANATISGNIIYNNQQSGVGLSSTSSSISVSNNQIFDHQQEGINVSSGASSVTITANNIYDNGEDGIDIAANNTVVRGNTIKNNVGSGVAILLGSNNTIGGSQAGHRNIISGNTGFANIIVYGSVPFGAPANQNIIQGNYIGTNDSGQYDASISQSPGVVIYGDATENLVGGADPAQRNVIAGNDGAGVIVSEFELPGVYTGIPARNAILGNSIHRNPTGSAFSQPLSGLGIDLVHFDLDPNTFLPLSAANNGPSPNDGADTDIGPNNYMNFPVINSAIQNSTALTVNFDLDAADSTNGSYRVEFFANDSSDPSGYGEGQTFLGAATVVNGTGQEAILTLANGTDLTGKSITATTTAVNTTTPSGFGATSEFSEALAALVVAPATTPSSYLATTGTNVWLYGFAILSLMSVGGYLVITRR